MLTAAFLVLPVVSAIAAVVQGADSRDVAITAAEILALATVLRNVVIPMLKAIPGWDRLPRYARTAVIVLISGVAATLDNLATGKPPLLSVLLAVGSSAAAIGAHRADKRRAEQKAREGEEDDEPVIR